MLTRERLGRLGQRSVVAIVAVAVAMVPLGLASPSADAITVQPEQTWERGVISSVADGDTVSVNITWAADPMFIAPPASLDPVVPSARTYCADRLNPDGSLPNGVLRSCRVRLVGIQAPEKANASGGPGPEQC